MEDNLQYTIKINGKDYPVKDMVIKARLNGGTKDIPKRDDGGLDWAKASVVRYDIEVEIEEIEEMGL
ncbi:MAG: hypothetical protein GY799_12195 [Desulfobulbaceae bacterium]|nr:hypothetical protein [Desulfobulbaceae bacterium]